MNERPSESDVSQNTSDTDGGPFPNISLEGSESSGPRWEEEGGQGGGGGEEVGRRRVGGGWDKARHRGRAEGSCVRARVCTSVGGKSDRR